MHDIANWNLLSVTILFVFSIAIYFLCALAAPEASGEVLIDMEAFYWNNYRAFYAVALLCIILAIAANALYLQTPNTALFFEESAAALPFFVPCALALAVRARWAQWVAGIGMLSIMVTSTIAFSSTLH